MKSSSSSSPSTNHFTDYLILLILRPFLAITFIFSLILLCWVLAWKLVLVHVPLVQEIWGLRKKPQKSRPPIRRLSQLYSSFDAQKSANQCLMLVQVRELTTSNNAFHYDDGGTGSERDRVALLGFKSKIKLDPQGILTSWNSSTHFCQWEGVTCGRRHQRVTRLDVRSRGLVGTLSPYIGNLSFLRNMSLFNNTFQGHIPPEIGRLFRLERLSLESNSFEGEIPANLFRCSNLMALGLGHNKLVGEIPHGLGSLSKLRALSIASNNFRGGIPRSIGNLTSLEYLGGFDNKFGGPIPDIFHRLANFKDIWLAGNELIDGIPQSLYNLSQLTNLSLAGNQLNGNLPLNFGLLFPKLHFLHIGQNNFTGPIPFSLSNATQLQTIALDVNKFSGKVSVDFKDMKSLESFNIGANNLGTGRPDDMDFLISLLNCSGSVGMWRNNFGGTLPATIGNLSTSITSLGIGQNQLHGHIPSWMGTLTNLQTLALYDNHFTGPIPESLGLLHKLNKMWLNGNMLSGQIPASLGNLTSMSQLQLYENRLNGAVPPSLGKCKKLEYLYIDQNSLSGSIPKEIFEISTLIQAWMEENRFTGLLPSQVGGLKHLTLLSLSNNQLSGSIPDSLDGCESLQYLYMQNNFFNGSIPPKFTSLRGIEQIDLSHNNLSGEIPKDLGTLALTYLNLSFNDFEGEIPTRGIFTNTSIVSLQGNKRLCGGVSELKFPICFRRKKSKRRTIHSLKIELLTIFSSVMGVILLSSFLYFQFRRKQKVKTSESEKTLMKVSYGMLHKATDGFSTANLLGLGSFGSVFKGILNPDQQVVAIKVFKLQRHGALKSFMAECEALRNIRHRNLLKIVTSCSTIDYQGNDFKSLVYEFMPKGNLDIWLHQIPESTITRNLNLLQRINISIDVACAIYYLHHDCHVPIIHCDLKPSNILLDDDMIAHVGDFGIAKFLQELSTAPNQLSSTGIRGTIGYAPPEYGIGSAVSTMGDVYSFGVVLLEMITGKRPTDSMFEGGLNLHKFARLALSGRVMEILDPILVLSNEAEAETNISKCLISMVSIGIACSMEDPQDRMNISTAVRELQLARDILQQQKAIKN